jgi:hypothetical protein
VENDWRESVKKLSKAHDMSTKTVHSTIHKDFKLSKKSARWVLNLLEEEMKKKPVRERKVIMEMVAAASWPSQTMFSLWVSQQREKKELTGLTLTRETS